jgi:signal transduction histidine kinase
MGGVTAAGARLCARMSPGRLVAAAGLLGVLTLAGSEARHAVLALLAALGLFGAGIGFLLRYRVTGTRASFDIGAGLALLGVHRPASDAVEALIEDRLPAVPGAVGLVVVLAAAAVFLRAFPARRPRPRAALVTGLLALGSAAAVARVAAAAGCWAAAAISASAAGVVLAGALWILVAAAAWRSDPLAAGDRSSHRALAGIALSVGLLGFLHALPALAPGTTGVVRVVGDLGLLAVALTAVAVALRRLTDALAGQERYVVGLLEQLAGHERHLGHARACLHDSRAAVAGVRAASSAVRHLTASSEAELRADLQESVALELARLERMLRLPERDTAVATVDLDQVLRPLVVSHRERGLQIDWGPAERSPVVVDGDALAVIVGNLLGNALAHAPEALCRVTVDVDDRLTVTVSDDGPGLSPARRAAAFEAGVHRSGSPGEGLGLAISRDLARRHGGDLVAEGVTVGSRFVLTLPLQATEALASALLVGAPA